MFTRVIGCSSILFVFSALPSFAQTGMDHYALFMADEPVASRFASRTELQSAAARNYQQQIELRQQALRGELAARNYRVSGSVSTTLNAIFVTASSDRLNELRSLPGVIDVVPMRRLRVNMNRAATLMNAPAAWNLVGGPQNGGAGIKIAILDSGIDQNHPAFQDSSLPMPAGFPKVTASHEEDRAFTSNKVIVARSYVRQIAGFDTKTGASPNPATSNPDDYTPRDRLGHGTAVASVAAGNTNTGDVTFTGMAPKAYLGNYKIFGSPGLTDFPSEDVLIAAIDDALNDGMDVANLSAGVAALTGPLDTGAACGRAANVPCDPLASAFESAAQHGMVITVAAGNDGGIGLQTISHNTLSSPATAPSVIAVGASTNSHAFYVGVFVNGNVAANLKNIEADPANTTWDGFAAAAPLVDVVQLGDDGFACSPLPANSLNGSFALIQRGGPNGGCLFTDKVGNATQAGAVGVILYMADSSPPFSIMSLSSFTIPVVMISQADGQTLKSYVDANPKNSVSIDPAGFEDTSVTPNLLADFSSPGPFIGTASLLKPDLVAVGAGDVPMGVPGIYAATQSYDPSPYGIYSQNGYAALDGTSFSSPMVAGAAALVKQKLLSVNPKAQIPAAQIKSSLVNTAAQDPSPTDDLGNPVDASSLGAGRLDAAAAVGATVSVSPTSVAFPPLKSGTAPVGQTLQITNNGPSTITLNVTVGAANSIYNAATNSVLTGNGKPIIGPSPAVDKPALTINPGASASLTVTLPGAVSTAGSYTGAITLAGSGVSLHVPYVYVMGDGVIADLLRFSDPGPLYSPPNDPTNPFLDFVGAAGQDVGRVGIRLLDAYGVPVVGQAVTFTPTSVTLQKIFTATDGNGVASAEVILGSQPGNGSVTVRAGSRSTRFFGLIRPTPVINAVLDAEMGLSPVAPGSYVSLYGAALSAPGSSDTVITSPLPLVIDDVTVSFDVPSKNISVPAHLLHVDATQVNVQVPWELQGQSSAQVKVIIDESVRGQLFTLALSDYAPTFFVNTTTAVVDAADQKGRYITSSNPAVRGQAIMLYANGLGPVTNQPATGEATPIDGSRLSKTTTPCVVTLGGQQVTPDFCGIAPGTTGEYQINIQVPTNISAGNQPITVTVGGKTSPSQGPGSGGQTVILPVQ